MGRRLNRERKKRLSEFDLFELDNTRLVHDEIVKLGRDNGIVNKCLALVGAENIPHESGLSLMVYLLVRQNRELMDTITKDREIRPRSLGNFD